jgi:hypothetical protein
MECPAPYCISIFMYTFTYPHIILNKMLIYSQRLTTMPSLPGGPR